MSSFVPKVRWTKSATPIGLPTSNTKVWDYDYSGLLVSEAHWRRVRKGFAVWSGGGPFYVHREKLTNTGKRADTWKKNGVVLGQYTTCGIAGLASNTSPSQPVPASYSVASQPCADNYATLYKRARPGNPVADMGQFLIELRDLPQLPFRSLLGKRPKRGFLPYRNGKFPIQEIPRFLKNALGNYRALGSEYLNVVFGWAPFVRDLQKMYNLWQTIDKRMAQLVRENGKYIRRKATLTNDVTTTQTGQVYTFPYANVLGAPPTYATGTTAYTVTTRTIDHMWFSGSFRYYIPDVGSSLWTARAKAALFGALPTPELLWEVLPWSWLIDWFANVGDVLSNASTNAVDNLTLRYSFVMKHTSVETHAKSFVFHTASTSPNDSWPRVETTYNTTKLVESKLRRGGGNPFGLDVQLPSLSTYQLGILAALGLSRSSVR